MQSIKDSTPTTPEFFTRRNALDEVAKVRFSTTESIHALLHYAAGRPSLTSFFNLPWRRSSSRTCSRSWSLLLCSQSAGKGAHESAAGAPRGSVSPMLAAVPRGFLALPPLLMRAL